MVIEIITNPEAIKKLNFIPEYLIRAALEENSGVIGGYENDQLIVIGMFSYVQNDSRTIHIDYLYVLDEYRNKGFGRKYLQQVEDAFKKNGIKRFIFEFVGTMTRAEEWEYFTSHAGYKPVSANKIEKLWCYFANKQNILIKDKTVAALNLNENIRKCNSEDIPQILKENYELYQYLINQGLSLTEESLIYEEKGKVLAALIIEKTDRAIALLGTFGADKNDTPTLKAIIAMFKYLDEQYDYNGYELNFRIESSMVENALNCIITQNDIESAYIKSSKEI